MTPEGLRAVAAMRPALEDPDFRAGGWGGGGTDAAGVMTMHYAALDAEAEAVLAQIRPHLEPFDWMAWVDDGPGRRLYENPDALDNASADDLGRLLFALVRGDRFTEGLLLGAFQDGLMLRIARRAEALFHADAPPA